MNERIMTALSGGVDSSVAAMLISEAAPCAGAMMRLYVSNGDIGDDGYTCGERDASLVCRRLGIPFFLFDMQEEFKDTVIDYFIKSYIDGETPNPCVLCNKRLKFGSFLKSAEENGYTHIATGHYARVRQEGERHLLYKGKDVKKDQSYVLWSLTQDVLSRLYLPLGELTKSEAREAAREAELVNADKGDSQDICFVPDGDYASFIERMCKNSFPDGDFVLEDGTVMGRHKGLIRYTVGQRRGLGLSLKAPLYVKKKDAVQNRVILCTDDALHVKRIEARSVNWIACDVPCRPIRCRAKIRYHHAEALCTVTADSTDSATVEFDEAQRAPAPGQSVVFYDGDCVIGGGIIG